MDRRCGSCRHWYRFEDDRYVRFGIKQGTCSLTTVLQGDVRHPGSKARAEAVLFADSVRDVNRFLSTDEDFGCTQFEAKP